MGEYLSPGIYIDEVDRGPKPIEGVSTSTAAFLGLAPGGPANKPVFIANWTQYVETFSALEEDGTRNPHMPGAYLSHAVYAYFNNGGSRCYVSRLVPSAAATTSKPRTVEIPTHGAKGATALIATAKAEEDVTLEIRLAGDDGKAVDVTVRSGGEVESYAAVGLDSKGGALAALSEQSTLVTVALGHGATTVKARTPEAGLYTIPAAPTDIAALTASDFEGDVTIRSGTGGLEVADDAAMVCCPDILAAYQQGLIDLEGVKAAQLALIAHCERMGDRVAILDTPPGLGPQDVRKWRLDVAGYDSKYAAMYYPWVRIMGPGGKPIVVPPSGHIAGVYARNDATRGVHKAPANEVLAGVLAPATQITRGEQDVLNPNGVNCIRTFRGRGIRVWGARTVSSDPAWRYVPVRRLFNFVEKSIENGTHWVVFEPNTPDLWARVRRDVGAFLRGVWRDGMLFGRTPSEAYYVKCDEELNPPDVRDRGQLVIEVGLAPVKPAEFVIFRISQWTGGGA